MFDSETYDPFKHFSSNHEVHQRINRTNSQIGAPAVLDWAEHDKTVEALVGSTFGRVGPLDEDEEARNLARETIAWHRMSNETIIGDHAGLQYDPSNPITQARHYGLFSFESRVLFPLSKHFTWQQLADKYLTRHSVCDIRVSIGCDQNAGTDVLPIRCGEFVCIYKTCVACREWFANPDRDYFRRREFFNDEFDRQ